ncbi:MAG: CAP domain-containing protein [Prolixibacteraceae bacterium]|nr:CAP domain-containing protein [Prolixibacteraceae bacterium]
MRIIFIILVTFIWTFAFAETSESIWPDEVNTAQSTSYLEKLEKQVILELNKVRSNPKRYAEEYLDDLQSGFNGKLFTYPGQETVRTQEGISPLIECIRELKSTTPVPILKPEEGLTRAAEDLVKDQQKHGGIGHIARNGSTPQKRIEKYGEWDVCLAEDITYGSFEARQIVIFLLIDDGVPDRSHRKNILNPCFRLAGVSFGNHPSYQTMCVIDYAGAYKTKSQQNENK